MSYLYNNRKYLYKLSIIFIIIFSLVFFDGFGAGTEAKSPEGYDIVFVVDSSFGMTKYFNQTMRVLQRFVRNVKESEGIPFYAGLLLYRDRDPDSGSCKSGYPYEWQGKEGLTDDVYKIIDALSKSTTGMCDDKDEHGAVFDALNRAIVDTDHWKQWHENHSKFIFLIGSEPPHPKSNPDRNPSQFEVKDISKSASKNNIRLLTFKIGKGNYKEYKELAQNGRFRMVAGHISQFEQNLETILANEWEKALANEWSNIDPEIAAIEEELDKKQREIDDLESRRAIAKSNAQKNDITEQITDYQKKIASEIGISSYDSEVDLLPIFEAVRGVSDASRFNLQEFDRRIALNSDHAMWPVYQFLKGECFRLQGNTEQAFQEYRELAIWASGDPYKDGRGSSSLAAFALWRWIEILDKKYRVERGQVSEFLQTMEKLLKMKMIRNVFRANMAFSINLPKIEENLYRYSSRLAWSVGMTDEAVNLFFNYIKICQEEDFNQTENQILNKLLDSGITTRQELAFLQAKRLVSLGKMDSARKILDELQEDYSAQIRTKAQFELAKIERIKYKTKDRERVTALLDKVIQGTPDNDLKQEALYMRIKTLFREGPSRDLFRAMEDIETLISQYPNGQFTDDALYFMARHYQQTEESDKAMEYYGKLRTFKGPNDWFNFSYFQPAMILYGQNSSRNFNQIETFLKALLSKRPDGPLRLTAKFWLARIYEDTGRREKSRRMFEEIISETPYDYYALRSQMHLNAGSKASKLIWPDSETKRQIGIAYQKSYVDTALKKINKYYERLQNALSTGLYSQALSSENMLRKTFPSLRVQNIPLSDLDASGLFAYTALLISFREDARTANSLDKDYTSNLQIAGAVGVVTRDFPLAISLAGYRSDDQKDDRFLATAFPHIYPEFFKRAGADNNVKPELLYSVVREESFFFPSALSPQGAVGIFQFIPSTFRNIIKKYKQFDIKDKG